MSKLTDFKVLTFDVYGTLIDWETGVLTALAPSLPPNHSFTRAHLLDTYHHHEAAQQRLTPSLPYTTLLSTIHPHILSTLSLPAPSQSSSAAFGSSVGTWPAFRDTVAALRTLSRHYKLVVLSNVDREAFSLTNAGPLEGVKFDMILTAQDVGSYKPDLRNFEYMLKEVEREFGVGREQVLQTAQSQFHDHHPAKKVGVRSCWIERPGAVMGNVSEEEVVADWRFKTLGEMAEEVEREAKGE
jgi:2-haloalkanoic acid dehalogenase type II